MRRIGLVGALLAVATTGCTGHVATKHAASAPKQPPPAAALAASPAALVAPPPTYRARVVAIDEAVRARMGTSWRPGCPVGLEDLRVIEMSFWGFDGLVHTGELMVHRRYAEGIAGVFRKLFDARFPIERMVLANGYMGNDPPLALRNNTAGFNCRRSVGSAAWSEHAYGRAVDINPDRNPYVSPSGRIEPPFGRHWTDRSLEDPGMIRRGDVVVEAFRAVGWRWGGNHRRSKDWMHFSVTGR